VPRQVAMYLCRELLACSSSRSARRSAGATTRR
jgi:chromosomal replication initiation ATPase DnaA